MTLHIPDKWLWDFWFAQDGNDTHIFYLQAARSLGDPDLRHWHVSIGHAVSQDLMHWAILPDAIRPTPVPATGSEAWDSHTTWTGSIIRRESLWYMFYTGSKPSEKGLIQRIGLATSNDLMTWEKHPDNPLMIADPRWYEQLDLAMWHDQAWRDPWVFRDSESGLFHAYITARAKNGSRDARGVFGHATSSDLIHWDIQPPISAPSEFGHMEVPQLVAINNRYYLLFSVPSDSFAKTRFARTNTPPVTGTHYLVADDPLGPFRYLDDDFLMGDAIGSLYSGKLIQARDGTWQFMAFQNMTADGQFVGDISDPLPITVHESGKITLA